MKSIKEWISHNQGIVVALVICSVLLVWTFGCESKVTSPISEKQVTRAELNLEINVQVKQMELQLDNMQKQAALQFVALDRQDDVKRKLFNFAALTAQSGTLNPSGIITLVGTLLGLGFATDNRIKDKVIKNRPLNNGTTPTKTA